MTKSINKYNMYKCLPINLALQLIGIQPLDNHSQSFTHLSGQEYYTKYIYTQNYYYWKNGA